MLLGSVGAIGKREPRWLYRWFRPWGANGEAGFVRRVKLALSPKNHLYTLPLLSPLLIMGIIGISLSTFGNRVDLDFLWGMMAGFGGAAVITYPIDLTKSLANYRQKIAVSAAQKLVRRVPPALSNEILVPLTQSSSPGLRIAAAVGLRELGTKEGGEALRLLGDDKDSTVAAAARDAYSDLHQVYRGIGLLSVRTMDTFKGEHAYLIKKLNGKKYDKNNAKDYETLAEMTRQINEIVYSQLPLRRSFPDIYCKDCNARAEHLRYEEWEWVRCRVCKEVHGLKTGVKQVIGQIGGQVEWEVKDGLLHLNLWNDTDRKASAADLDVLEIIGGSNINYDWAVSALVDKLHNQSLGVGTRIAVKMVNAPVLEANTLQLLKTLDQSLLPAMG